jgi:SagB-type dehydrogenase family enzyme
MKTSLFAGAFTVAFGAVSVLALGMMAARAGEKPARREQTGKPAPATQVANEAAMIRLPAPSTEGGQPLVQAIAARRSVRAYDGKPVPLAAVSQLLWAAQGVTQPAPKAPATWNAKWGEWRGGLRAAPSAGALYPLEVYVLATSVDGLEPGLYRYIPVEHTLVRAGAAEANAKALAQAAFMQQDIAQAPIAVVITGVYERTAVKYGERAPRYVHIEAGAAAENLMLQADALGFGTVYIGAFADEAVSKTLGLPADHAPLGIIPVGHPAGK